MQRARVFFRLVFRLVVGAIIGASIGAAIGASSYLALAYSQPQPLRDNILSDVPNAATLGVMIGSLSGLVLAWRRERQRDGPHA